MFRQDYLDDVPTWYQEDTYHDLILSNDIDSLWSCTLLQQIKGWDINYFYDFNSFFKTQQASSDASAIGVDIDFCKSKCFSNHVTMLTDSDTYNKQAINLNIIDRINRENYFDKYCGSTLLMLYALYDIPLPQTEEGQLMLLAIDSTYLGYYSEYVNAQQANKYYLCDVMGLTGLYDLLQSHARQDFERIAITYGLKAAITLDSDGRLKSDIDLIGISKAIGIDIQLPKDRFNKVKNYDSKQATLPDDDFITAKEDGQIISMALTRKNTVKYSLMRI